MCSCHCQFYRNSHELFFLLKEIMLFHAWDPQFVRIVDTGIILLPLGALSWLMRPSLNRISFSPQNILLEMLPSPLSFPFQSLIYLFNKSSPSKGYLVHHLYMFAGLNPRHLLQPHLLQMLLHMQTFHCRYHLHSSPLHCFSASFLWWDQASTSMESCHGGRNDCSQD